MTAGGVKAGPGSSAGEITSAGVVKVQKGASTGAVTEGATVQKVTLPTVNANPEGTGGILRKPKDAQAGALMLMPGRYGKVESAPKDNLILVGGDYHFVDLTVDAFSTITIDLSNGQPLVIRVAEEITFGSGVKMKVTGGDASDIIIMADGSKLWLRDDGVYYGTMVAPNGNVIIGQKSELTGAAWGREVWVMTDSVTKAAAYRHPVP
ncbi:MAG: hypothetical protein FJ319_13425 [SAR202 cluster bacterium]|nr:hypothetical protein [SAR202 cluster bacterium]